MRADQAGLDNGDRSWQVRTSSLLWLPAEGCQDWTPGRSNGRAFHEFSAFDEELYPLIELMMIDG